MVVARKEVVPCLGNACCVYSEGGMREEEGGRRGGRRGGRKRGGRGRGKKRKEGKRGEGGRRKKWRDINNVMRVEQLCKFVYYSILQHHTG